VKLAEIGQDKVVFHPNTMNENGWSIDGVHPMRSKGGTGGGKMISGFKSRVFGFGLEMSEEELEEVNRKRRQGGKTYSSYAADAATIAICSDDHLWECGRWILKHQSHVSTG
jgi:hypothetical protein